MTLLSKHEKRNPRRLPKSANLSESLILSLFLYFFTCSVTVDRLSQLCLVLVGNFLFIFELTLPYFFDCFNEWLK